VGESAEDLLPADPVLGDANRFRLPGVGLGRGELAKGTVRTGSVVVLQVLGQHPSQVASLTISNRSKSSRRRVPMILSQMAFAWAPAAGWPEF
jgi:hypothetical protein